MPRLHSLFCFAGGLMLLGCAVLWVRAGIAQDQSTPRFGPIVQLRVDGHFDGQAQGGRPGDAVFAVGHSPENVRAEIRIQHAFRRAASGAEREASRLLGALATLTEEKRARAGSYRAVSFFLRFDLLSSSLVRAMRVQEEGAHASAIDFRAVPEQPPALDAAHLAEHIRRVRVHLPPDSCLIQRLDAVGEPARIVHRSGGSSVDGTAAPEQPQTFSEEGPARRSPRLADGRVEGDPYSGTVAPSVTTFFGLYGQHASGTGPVDAPLPRRWQEAPLDGSTPLPTIASTDLAGEYGAPLLNQAPEVVGPQVDDNVQAAAAASLFGPDRMRMVSLDVRGLLEGRSAVYEANAPVQEIRSGAFPAQ